MNKGKISSKVKENKAITLIALVITIIVLLILAGVTIAQITSQDSAPNLEVEATGSVPNEKIQVGANGDSTYSVSGVNLPKLLAEKIPATVGEYVARQFNTRASTEGSYNYSVGADNKLTIADKTSNKQIVSGTILENGTISWDETTTSSSDSGSEISSESDSASGSGSGSITTTTKKSR